MLVLFWGFYLLFIAVFAPIGMLWNHIWRNPKQTSSMVLFVVSAIMLSVYFELPWDATLKIFGLNVSAFEVVNFLVQMGPLVVNVIFFVVWFSIPVTLFILLKTTFQFSKANPGFFVGRMLSGFIAAFYGFVTTGYVPIKLAFYGIGALIIVFCIKTITHES